MQASTMIQHDSSAANTSTRTIKMPTSDQHEVWRPPSTTPPHQPPTTTQVHNHNYNNADNNNSNSSSSNNNSNDNGNDNNINNGRSDKQTNNHTHKNAHTNKPTNHKPQGPLFVFHRRQVAGAQLRAVPVQATHNGIVW